jgi:ribosomal protein L10
MSSITIHNIDTTIDTLIRKEARQKGTSLNKAVQQLLKKALHVNNEPQRDRMKDFRDLCGVWTEHDAKDFAEATAVFEKIDKDDWK